ncbi:transcription factor 7-like 1-A [Syngnathoides biaculeatus]|uniref:transcription factor 7-like 1-A n=1 Tax=Syngnathoides biaculeatus TaxID=300417 RepID=UPI002ADE3429|nr:transcription factor 7-like 1-A [Syngnathoides biaculeatus]XP_061700330.1 transcription factor 7-like 1-A [Syngnathoides biaculeatus]XP_061700331.1 transcription factor 7-like 1-A [Syngnathoides biaculeatus]
MEPRQQLPTDEDIKWDKLLDNILKSSDTILWGTAPTRPLPAAMAASEPKGPLELPPLANDREHLESLMDGDPADMDDELSNVLDDFWLPDYLGGQPGSIHIQDQDDNAVMMPMYEGVNQAPPPVRLNGEASCGGAGAAVAAAASSSSDSTELSPDPSQMMQQDGDRPYIKKPPNAFMLFRKEQSPNVVSQFNITNSAVVNKILGKMWKSLPKKLQAKYYQQAEEHKVLHSLQHPDWSCTENYGKKRKRDRSRHSACVSKSLEDVPPVVERCCAAMGHAPGEDASCHHYHKSVVGDTHTYAQTRGC